MQIEYIPGQVPEYTEEAGGKGLGQVLGVVASFIIPYAAPAISSAIGLSSTISQVVGSKLIGGALGSAVTGGVLGAAQGYATGSNIGQSAIMGALGGAGGASAKYFNGQGIAPGVGASVKGMQAGLNVTPTAVPGPDAGNLANFGVSSPDASQAGVTAALDGAKGAAAISPEVSQAAQQMGVGQNVVGAIRRLPGQIASRLLSRDGLAMLTQMAVGAMQPDPGLTEAIQARRAELETARQRDIQLYNLQLTTARDILNEAEHFDPQHIAMNASNQAKILGARQEDAQLRDAASRGRDSGRREVIKRQAGLNTARAANAAYNQGWQMGEQTRDAKRTAARAWLPQDYPVTRGESQVGLAQQQQAANDQTTAGVSQWAGLLFEDPAKPQERPLWGGSWGN